MEPAGVALSVVVLIKPLISAIDTIITEERGFGTNAEHLRLRFSAQQTRLEAVERLLFDANKLGNGKRLWDTIPERVRTDIMDMLRHLYELLERFLLLRKRYDIVRTTGLEGRQAFDELFRNPESVRLDTVEKGVMPFGNTREDSEALRKVFVSVNRSETSDLMQKSSKFTRRLRWVFKDSKSAAQIITEFETWNARIKDLLEAVWWPMPVLSTLEQVNRLEKDSDVQATGLGKGAPIRKIFLNDKDPEKEQRQFLAVEVPKDAFKPEQDFSGKSYGTILDQQKQRHQVLVEYKSYDRGPDNSIDRSSAKRIRLLALLLSSSDAVADPHIPRCLAVFNNRMENQYGFAFAIPPTLNPSIFHPLSSTLKLEKGKKPSLECRLSLALKLARTLQKLHSLGWVHKSLRSENILLFRPVDMTMADADATAAEAKAKPIEESPHTILKTYHPLLFGFEYSRPINAFSSRRTDTDILANLYRHPDRWNTPDERFSKQHDIYSLGVILLELGLWEKVDKIDRGGLIREGERAGGDAVRRRLLKHVEQRSEFYMGTTYSQVVKCCLDGRLAMLKEEDVQAEFAREVTERIEALVEGLVE